MIDEFAKGASALKLAFCGYDFFSNCLARAIERGHDVVEIFSFMTDDNWNFNKEIRQIAADHRIPLRLSRINMSDMDRLVEQGADLLVVAGYPYRIPVHKYLRAINIHPSLLPQGRGPWPLPWHILKRLKNGGVTVHKIATQLDAGDILAQSAFPLAADETLESISCKCKMIAPGLLDLALNDLSALWQNAQKQGEGSYWEFPSEAQQTLDWSLSVCEIDARVRAFGCMESTALIEGDSYSVMAATCWQELHELVIGTVALRTKGEVVVAASDGFVCLRVFKKD